MLQFYFLSVFLNCITGLILISETTKKTTSTEDVIVKPEGTESVAPTETKKSSFLFIQNPTFKLIIGILAVLTGILKLLSVVPNDVPVIGDLIPSIAGLLGGGAVLFSYFTTQTTLEVKPGKFFSNVFVMGKRYVGVICLIAATLHFLFPKVPLL